MKTGVSKKTSLLVIGTQDIRKTRGEQLSSKHRKAEKLIEQGARIRIVGEDDFRAMAGLD